MQIGEQMSCPDRNPREEMLLILNGFLQYLAAGGKRVRIAANAVTEAEVAFLMHQHCFNRPLCRLARSDGLVGIFWLTEYPVSLRACQCDAGGAVTPKRGKEFRSKPG